MSSKEITQQNNAHENAKSLREELSLKKSKTQEDQISSSSPYSSTSDDILIKTSRKNNKKKFREESHERVPEKLKNSRFYTSMTKNVQKGCSDSLVIEQKEAKSTSNSSVESIARGKTLNVELVSHGESSANDKGEVVHVLLREEEKSVESINDEFVRFCSKSDGVKYQMAEWKYYFSNYYVDANDNYVGNFDEYLARALRFLNVLPQVDWSQEIKQKRMVLPDQVGNYSKKTLVLDLDESLVHCDIDFLYKNHDAILKCEEGGDEILVPIIKRPGLQEFLEFASHQFEVVCFTAGCREYADVIMDYIDPEEKFFSHRLYRDSCLYLEPGIYIKDTSIIANRNPKDIVIVDNSLISFANHLSNGILITSFYDDKDDSVLNSLIGYLESVIVPSDDVRISNESTFGYSEYKEELRSEVIRFNPKG